MPLLYGGGTLPLKNVYCLQSAACSNVAVHCKP